MDRNVSQNYPKSIAMCRLIARARPLRCARATVDRSATAEPPSQPAERRWCENIVDRNVSKNYPKSIAKCWLIARARPLGCARATVDRSATCCRLYSRPSGFAVWPPRPHSTLASSALDGRALSGAAFDSQRSSSGAVVGCMRGNNVPRIRIRS